MTGTASSNTLTIPEAAWGNTDAGTQQIVIRIHSAGTGWTKDVAEDVMQVLDRQELEDCEVRVSVLATEEEVRVQRQDDGYEGHVEFDDHAEVMVRGGRRYVAAWVWMSGDGGTPEGDTPEGDALLNSLAHDDSPDFPHETDPQENA